MKIECTIEDLYLFNNETKLVDKGFFDVETQYGFKKIKGVDITAKNSKKYFIKTDKNKSLEVSPNHLIFTDKWVFTKSLNINDKIKTKDGYELLKEKILLPDTEDLYDIEVDEVSEFYANGIVSHNSSFIDLPKILYYGKLDRFKKDDIANRLNKHGWIKGEIEVNPSTIITIERNLSPSNLLVKKNDDDIGKSGIVDYQNYLDIEVTGLPYHIFSNIISLSINDFKSFISMTPNDKRIIIDKLFSMQILNQMYKFIKDDLKDIRVNMSLFDREMKTIKANIDTATKELQNLEIRVNEDNTKKINDIIAKLTEYKPKLKEAYDKLNEYTGKKNEINKSYNIFIQQKNKINHSIDHIKKQLDLFNQDKCPTCSTPFTEARFDLIKEQLQGDIRDKKIELEELSKNEEIYKTNFKSLDEGIKLINEFIIKVQTSYNTLSSELDRLKKEKPAEFESIKNIISENSERLIIKENDKEKIVHNYQYLEILESLYSDSGVKQKIIESYLPTLNSEILLTLNELHFPYSIIFDTNFDAKVTHLGLDIDPSSMSTGETKKANICILISFLRLMKRKYPNLNIFMLDEVLSSLDADSVYDVIVLLRAISKELKINILIISHNLLPSEFFSYVINLEKNNGFSDFTISNLNE
jgi:DNA repair exonuclease SbcCD ATPase subunit